MKKLLALGAVFLISGSAAAADWFPLDGAKGFEVQIDLNSIVPAGDGLIKAWTAHSFAEKKVSKGYPTFAYQSSVQLEIYDCTQRTTDILREVFYSDVMRGGEVVKSNAYSRKDLKLSDVVPGSIGEGALEFACAWVKAKQEKAAQGRSTPSPKR